MTTQVMAITFLTTLTTITTLLFYVMVSPWHTNGLCNRLTNTAFQQNKLTDNNYAIGQTDFVTD